MDQRSTDFVEFEHGPIRVAGRDGKVVALSTLWLARGFLQEQVVPTAETQELIRQMDTASDEAEAQQALRSFCAWADAAGVRVAA
ncbi:MAG: hypothetical protein K0R27_2088 [Xanthobacteraceae bacterium]|jgi:hypothetical protein|nr:hypothetical protein [Xanthobacteraceae bacterium]